ncbi:MAG: hypothetical protein Kow0090_05770 [Myxococcota bacterium]
MKKFENLIFALALSLAFLPAFTACDGDNEEEGDGEGEGEGKNDNAGDDDDDDVTTDDDDNDDVTTDDDDDNDDDNITTDDDDVTTDDDDDNDDNDDDDDSAGLESGGYAFALTSDYVTGGFSAIKLDTREVKGEFGGVHSDATAREYNGKIYVVNRLGSDKVEVRDPKENFAVKGTIPTGDNTNPQDICFASDEKAYIPLYGDNNLAVVNPLTATIIAMVDLGGFADGDGIPEMTSCFFSDGKVYVSLQLLDENWTPTGNGLIAVVNSETDEATNVISLNLPNPVTAIKESADGKFLLVGSAGAYGAKDGAVEVLEKSTDTVIGTLVTEESLGGDVMDFAMSSGDVGFALISDENFATKLVKFTISSGDVEEVFATAGFDIGGIALNSLGEIYVSDRTAGSEGIRIFSADTGAELTANPITLALPPMQITFFDVK